MNDNNAKEIKEWMELFSNLYSHVDQNRTPEQIWITIMAHASSMGECIRTFSFKDLIGHAAHTFCWLCSFVNRIQKIDDPVFRINETLCGMVSLKYPLKCGHCEKDECRCDPRRMDQTPDKPASYERLLGFRNDILAAVEGYKFPQWQNKFNDIFGGRIHILTLETIGFHFLEEVGEAAVGIRKLSQFKRIREARIQDIDDTFFGLLTTVPNIVKQYRVYKRETSYTSKDSDMIKWRIVDAKMALVIEIGDTFSWFCAVMNKLDMISKSIVNDPKQLSLLSLEEQLRREYISQDGSIKCPTCGKCPCECVFYS